MELTPNPSDLRPEYQRKTDRGVDQAVNTSQTSFKMFNHQAQAAIRAAGRAVFHAFDGMTYNAIYPSKLDPQPRPERINRPLAQRPPLGVLPRQIWLEVVIGERIKDLLSAMKRYAAAGKPISSEWFNELHEYLPIDSRTRGLFDALDQYTAAGQLVPLQWLENLREYYQIDLSE